jgi:hypothetical protein
VACTRLRVIQESPMPETPKTSGGELEHQVYMIEGIILIFVKQKLAPSERDNAAQVLLDLVCETYPFLRLMMYKINRFREFDSQPPV